MLENIFMQSGGEFNIYVRLVELAHILLFNRTNESEDADDAENFYEHRDDYFYSHFNFFCRLIFYGRFD
jgi:hypothetical protein